MALLPKMKKTALRTGETVLSAISIGNLVKVSSSNRKYPLIFRSGCR